MIFTLPLVCLLATPAFAIVWDPQILAPNASSVWPVGTQQQVVWNITNIPDGAQNNKGTILLGYVDGPDGAFDEHLDTANPLASGFPLSAGSVQVTVPASTMPRDNAVIALFGDSGNISPQFSIVSLSGNVVSSGISGSSVVISGSTVVVAPSVSASGPADTSYYSVSVAPSASVYYSASGSSITLVTDTTAASGGSGAGAGAGGYSASGSGSQYSTSTASGPAPTVSNVSSALATSLATSTSLLVAAAVYFSIAL